MLTDTDIVSIDREKLHVIYENWPQHFRAASQISINLDHSPSFYNSIAMCGMGGSATSCDIISDLLQSLSTISSAVVRGHELPHNIDRRSLVVINSVSGNTRETISMMETASNRNSEVICISAGGKVKELAEKYGHQHISIPSISVPRGSLPYLLMPSLRLIDPFLKRSLDSDISSIPDNLLKVKERISSSVDDENNIAKKIANFFEDSFAFCFTSPSLTSAGTRFKNSLNENAKVHCLRESVLEASHNEIVPFTFSHTGLKSKVLLLRWNGDAELSKERFNKVSSLFNKIGQPTMELTAHEESLVNAIVSSIYILDYSTIFMAISKRINPTSTPAIDILKGM